MDPLPTAKIPPPPKYPVRYSEWCAAIREIKLLYFGRLYKQCAARCTELLEEKRTVRSQIHPVHATVISFYAASSLEILAYPLSSFSNTKLPLLTSARSYYLAAALFLATESSSTGTSPPSSIGSKTAISGDSNSPCSSPASSPPASFHSDDDGEGDEEDLTDARAFAASKARIAARRKSKVVRFSPSTSFTPEPATSADSLAMDAFFRTRAQLRLEAHSVDMARKLELHLVAVENLIAKTEEEKRGKRFGGVFDAKEERRAKRREWIMKRGWRNEEKELMDGNGV